MTGLTMSVPQGFILPAGEARRRAVGREQLEARPGAVLPPTVTLEDPVWP